MHSNEDPTQPNINKLNKYILKNPTVLKKKKPHTQKDTCAPMLIAALFTIARSWKQHKCPSTDEWIKKMWFIYTMEYYSAIKKERNWVSYRDVDGSRDCHTE